MSKATIVIPNINGKGWLKDSIESIYAQTEQDFDLRRHGTPLLLSTARHTGRTSLYRRNFPSYHRKHRCPCWNRAMLMRPLWMFFRIALRYRMLPEQSPRHRTTDEAISGRRLPDVFL